MFKGAEFYLNTRTGKLKQYLNYRCRDYDCNASLKIQNINDLQINPKLLKSHSENCKQLKNREQTFTSRLQQEQYDAEVMRILDSARYSIDNANSIYEKLVLMAKIYSAQTERHIFTPDKNMTIQYIQVLRHQQLIKNNCQLDFKFVKSEEVQDCFKSEQIDIQKLELCEESDSLLFKNETSSKIKSEIQIEEKSNLEQKLDYVLFQMSFDSFQKHGLVIFCSKSTLERMVSKRKIFIVSEKIQGDLEIKVLIPSKIKLSDSANKRLQNFLNIDEILFQNKSDKQILIFGEIIS